jgi:hypothetical protein
MANKARHVRTSALATDHAVLAAPATLSFGLAHGRSRIQVQGDACASVSLKSEMEIDVSRGVWSDILSGLVSILHQPQFGISVCSIGLALVSFCDTA